ncbi:MAG: polysaccharide biosynthesis/export family protein [Hoeflea sp.]|uniref:polysaccharide biosynthesis/export family protein n=1 Tax=Hoeflea sp. TaxID=1940281 RepID=UPI0032ED8425
MDTPSARLLSQYRARTLNTRFGFGHGRNSAAIGVGDQLKITIFEAGSDGLFSTTDTKQISFDLVVQPDGTGAIPYVGDVRFAGRTLAQARATIKAGLEGKAVQPDVIVTAVGTASRTATVSGAVNSAGLIPISLNGSQIAEVIAKAGGNSAEPYETQVTVMRGKKIAQVLYSSIIENSSENIYIYPGDQIFLTRDPQTFTVLGEATTNKRIEFGSSNLNLAEAVALAGGGSDNRVDANGYFVFRFEQREVMEAVLGKEKFHQLLAKGMEPDEFNRYPIVYQFDMSKPDSLFVAQNFRVNSRDVVYLSRHPAVDLAKFVAIVQGPVSVAKTVTDIAN